MKIIFSFLWFVMLLSGTQWANAQQPPLNATWKDSARMYIRELKEGALVVRLRTRSLAIEALRNSGKSVAADTLMAEQRRENIAIIQAFHTEFDFCKVYFMLTDSTDALLAGKRSGFFVNQSLGSDPTISIKEKFFMIAEKGSPVIQAKYDPTQSEKEPSEQSYLTETIVVRFDNLKPLKEPFPHYAQEVFPATLLPSDWLAKVQTLNKKLWKFYKKSN